MKRPWAFICASEGATSKHLRNYCREVYLLGYLPVCPKLQDSQYLVLEDAVERSEYTAIVRDKLLRCPMLVVCSRNQDATTNAQIGLAQKYNRIVTTLDGLKKKAEFVTERCFKFIDQETREVGYYNENGDLIESRPAYSEELQTTLFQIGRKTGTNN